MIHVHVYIHDICPRIYNVYMIHVHVYGHDTCPRIWTWYMFTYMYIIHVHVYIHDACPRICTWYMSTYMYMIHVHVIHCPQLHLLIYCTCTIYYLLLYFAQHFYSLNCPSSCNRNMPFHIIRIPKEAYI